MTACCNEAIREAEGRLSCGVAAQSCQGGQGEEDVEMHFGWFVWSDAWFGVRIMETMIPSEGLEVGLWRIYGVCWECMGYCINMDRREIVSKEATGFV